MNCKGFCSRCDISTNNAHISLQGDGNKDARIMFIGRSPTYKEMKTGIPQMNKAGEHFQLYLDLFNIHRDDIYITDSIKCKTPKDRHPSNIELNNCRSYLEEELNEVQPRIVVLLGITAIRSYFNIINSNIKLNLIQLQGKHIIHKDRIIIFAPHPSYVYKHKETRIEMYKVFVKLLKFIRITNPFHTTNIGL